MTTLIEALPEIEERLEELEPGTYSVGAMMHSGLDNEGVVLFFRQEAGDFGTLRWIKHPGGKVILFEGEYDLEYDEAVRDFAARVAK